MDDKPADDVESALRAIKPLVSRAAAGDRSALPELRAALDNDPRLWRAGGHLADLCLKAWVRLVAGDDLYTQESVLRMADEVRRDLAGDAPSPLEKLLVERVVIGWVQAHHADAVVALPTGDASPATRREAMRRQESSQRRLLQAVRNLAQLRRLLQPEAATPIGDPAGTTPLAAAG